METVVDVYQYYWNGAKHYPMIDINSEHISEAQRYDSPKPPFEYQLGLGAADLVIAKVTINLHAFAQGGGSYSEINFNEGTANYIQVAGLIAWPLH
jgi:hypothetical protein